MEKEIYLDIKGYEGVTKKIKKQIKQWKEF